MHVCSTRLGLKLTERELIHLEQCQTCKFEQQALTDLRLCANNSPLIVPPEVVWQKLQKSTVITNKIKRPLWQKITVMAASTLFAGFSWLIFNNYQLQNQLEYVLQVNQSLELQLIQNSMPTFRQAQLLNKVRKLEIQLMEATTTAEKLNLLKIRQSLIGDMVKLQQKGKKYEFSI